MLWDARIMCSVRGILPKSVIHMQIHTRSALKTGSVPQALSAAAQACA